MAEQLEQQCGGANMAMEAILNAASHYSEAVIEGEWKLIISILLREAARKQVTPNGATFFIATG
jgi:hypothetical protein